MADKEVYIGGMKLGYVTSAKGSPETNTESTQTFDGPVNCGMANVPHTVEFEKLRYGDLHSYREIEQIIDDMYENPNIVTVKETIHDKDGVWTKLVHYPNCLVDSDEYEIKADENTVESLSFKSTGIKKEYE